MKKLCVMIVIAIMLMAVLPTAILPASAAGAQKTQLTIYAPDRVHCLQAFDVSGQLLAGTNPAGVDGMMITVYRSTDGRKWTQLGTSVTSGGGYYMVQTSESKAGTYQYKASYTGGKLYASAQSRKVIATVAVDLLKHTTLTLSASKASLYVGDGVQVSACLKDGAGTPLQGQPVTIDFTCDQGQHFSMQGTTDAAGYCNPGCAMDTAGKYSIVATYAGDASYTSATSNTVPLEVKEKPLVTTTLTLDQPSNAVAGDPITFTGTLTAANGAVMYGKDVHIQVYNPTTRQYEDIATAATDGAGAFSASKPLGGEGTYQVQAVYAGGNGYAGDTSDTKNVVVAFNPRTTLTFAIEPTPVIIGNSVTLTGRLIGPDGNGISGQTIELQGYNDAGQWYNYFDVQTEGDGTFSYTGYTAEVGTQPWRAAFSGAGDYAGATSEPANLVVTAS